METGELADHDTTNIDYWIFSARFDGSFTNGIGFATGVPKYTDREGQGATLGAWGGYPYFVNGMIFHFFETGSLQNRASYKLQGSYDVSAKYERHETDGEATAYVLRLIGGFRF